MTITPARSGGGTFSSTNTKRQAHMSVTCCIILRKGENIFPKPEVFWDREEAQARYKKLVEDWVELFKDSDMDLELQSLHDDCVYYSSPHNEHIYAVFFMEMDTRPGDLWMAYTFNKMVGLKINSLTGVERDARGSYLNVCKSLHSLAGYNAGGCNHMTVVNEPDESYTLTIEQADGGNIYHRAMIVHLATETLDEKIGKIIKRKDDRESGK